MTETILQYPDVHHTLMRMVTREWGKLPYGQPPNFGDEGFEVEVTEERWAALQWNPPAGTNWAGGPPDPNASPKPTWEELLLLIRRWRLDMHFSAVRELDRAIDIAIPEAANSPVTTPQATVHVGGGIARMPALSHLAEAATLAGSPLHRAVLRRTDGEAMHLWTEAGVREVLGAVARNRNLAENARNKIAPVFMQDRVIFEDENGGLDATATDDEKFVARESALERFKANTARYDELLAAAVTELSDQNALPSDLSTLREVLIERLEAAATGHQKALKGALTQQAIDNWAACVDMDRALAEIAKQCSLGSIRISRADDEYWRRTGTAWAKIDGQLPESFDHDGDDPPDTTTGADGDTYRQTVGAARAKGALAAAKAAIGAVTPANVPVWHEAAVPPIPVTPGTVHQVAGVRTVTLCPTHPPGADELEADDIQIYLDGPFALDDAVDEITTGVGYRARRSSTKAGAPFELVFWMDDSVTQPVTFVAYARNLCGPSKVVVRLTPPAGNP